jgi:DNA adenine methylase
MRGVNHTIETSDQARPGFDNYTHSRKLSPLLKWAGGKEKELKYIIPGLPEHIKNYYEPFVGGGAVYTAVQAEKYFINDRSEELISFYRSIINPDRDLFFKALEEIIRNWGFLKAVIETNSLFFIKLYKGYSSDRINDTELKNTLFEFVRRNSDHFNGIFTNVFNINTENFIREIEVNLIRKIRRMKELEHAKHLLPEKDILDNLETALKSAFYMHFRHIYNNLKKYRISPAFRSAIFLFIRNYAYSGMFRYNSNGDFNVPYGGIGYNRIDFSKKVEYLKSRQLMSLLESTVIENLDFEEFLTAHQPAEGDFVFLDPPYDTEFSTYTKNEFTRKDQVRLADYLIKSCKGSWMIIIKNTDFIYNLYAGNGLNIHSFDKTYLVSFMNRNDKSAEHLIITNY